MSVDDIDVMIDMDFLRRFLFSPISISCVRRVRNFSKSMADPNRLNDKRFMKNVKNFLTELNAELKRNSTIKNVKAEISHYPLPAIRVTDGYRSYTFN